MTAGVDPLSILPKEIWCHVFEAVDNSLDLVPVYHTCNSWRRLLKNSRVCWMFPGVFHPLLVYLSKLDILHARQCCKGWRQVVDKYLQEEQPILQKIVRNRFPFENETGRSFYCTFHVLQTRLGLTRDPLQEQVQERFGVTPKMNPFPTRSFFHISHSLSSSELEFFQGYGHHLWSLVIYLFLPSDTSSDQLAIYIWQLLAHIPNVRKLCLHVRLGEVEHTTPQLSHFLSHTLVPPLVHLENLDLSVKVPQIQEKLLAGYAPQLRLYGFVGVPNSCPLKFPILKELRVTFRDIFNTHSFTCLKSIECPSLTHLNLIVDELSMQVPFPKDINQSGILEAAYLFAESLTNLTIVWAANESPFPPNLPCHLPHLTNLTLELSNIVNMDNLSLCFLTNLQSLRRITLYISSILYSRILEAKRKVSCQQKHHEGSPQSDRSTVDLLECLPHWLELQIKTSRMYASNIWQLLPSLQRIAIYKVDMPTLLICQPSDPDHPPRRTQRTKKVYTREELNLTIKEKK